MTALNASTRHVQPGLTVIKHLPLIASPTLVPTRAELTSGTDVSLEVYDWDGWAPEGSTAPSRAVGTKKVGGVPSVHTLQQSAFTLNSDIDGNDGRALFVEDLSGYVVFMDAGDEEDRLMDIFKTQVVLTTPVKSADGSAVHLHRVLFAIRDWKLNAAIPAAT